MYFAIGDEGTDGYRLRWRRGDEVRYDISSLAHSFSVRGSWGERRDGCNLQRVRPPARFPSRRPCHALVMGADTRLNIVQVPRHAARASRRGKSVERSERAKWGTFFHILAEIHLATTTRWLSVSVTFSGIRGIAAWH